jgi:magnesium transporter
MVRSLVQDFIRLYPDEAAHLVEPLAPEEVAALLERQEPALAAELLRRMPGETAAEALAQASASGAPPIVAALDPGTAATLLSRLDEERRQWLVALLDPALAKELSELMSYPPDVAGGFMDPRVTTFRPHTTAREALTRIRGLRSQRIQDVFLVAT